MTTTAAQTGSSSRPLKPRLDLAIRQIQVQAVKLDATIAKLGERDGHLFSKIIGFIQSHELHHASVYAGELAEIRKLSKTVIETKGALDGITLRLNTITELGDIVVTLPSALSVIRKVRDKLSNMLPEAESEITEISVLLGSILISAAQIGGYSINFEAANEDAEKFIAEVATVVEQRMKETFPEIPTVEGA